MRTHALALVGMMVVSLGLAGCKTCGCCCDSWGGLCGDSAAPDAKPAPEAKGQPVTKNFSPTQNMQLANTPPAQWNNAPAAKLAMPQSADAQVRVTVAKPTPAPIAPAATLPVVTTAVGATDNAAVRANWNAATPAAVTPVSAIETPAAPAAMLPAMEEMPTRRSVSMPLAPTATERETFEVPAPQSPTAVAVPDPTAPAPEPVAPFSTPRGEN